MNNQKCHFVLTVKDLKKSQIWYDKVLGFLGFTHAFVDDTNVYYKSDDYDFYIAIFQGHEEFKNDTFNRYRLGFHHLGLGVGKQETVDEMYNLLTDMGVNVDEEPHHYPDYGDELYYAIFFHDPDGLRLEVYFERH